MKIFLLGPKRSHIINFLRTFGDDVVWSENKIDIKKTEVENFDFIISYGYRYILPDNILSYYKDRVINMHISYLPWNRGADPNFWSFFENTPKGVTIHYIDNGIDTGDIIAQKEMKFSLSDTLATSYAKLTIEIEELFYETWPDIRKERNDRMKQIGKGTYHMSSDKDGYLYILKDGWETKVVEIKKEGEADERI